MSRTGTFPRWAAPPCGGGDQSAEDPGIFADIIGIPLSPLAQAAAFA
jgi:hypothetical protein